MTVVEIAAAGMVPSLDVYPVNETCRARGSAAAVRSNYSALGSAGPSELRGVAQIAVPAYRGRAVAASFAPVDSKVAFNEIPCPFYFREGIEIAERRQLWLLSPDDGELFDERSARLVVELDAGCLNVLDEVLARPRSGD
jgi:hypothetical protein